MKSFHFSKKSSTTKKACSLPLEILLQQTGLVPAKPMKNTNKGQLCGTCLTLLGSNLIQNTNIYNKLHLLSCKREKFIHKTLQRVSHQPFSSSKVVNKFSSRLEVSVKPFCVDGPHCHRSYNSHSTKSLKSKTDEKTTEANTEWKHLGKFAVFTSLVLAKFQ